MLSLLKSVLISATITILILASRHRIKEFYIDCIKPSLYCLKYGSYFIYYLEADITKFMLHGKMIKRNYKIKFYVPSENIYVEGSVMGLNPKGLIYVKEKSGDIIIYSLNGIRPKDICYIEK